MTACAIRPPCFRQLRPPLAEGCQYLSFERLEHELDQLGVLGRKGHYWALDVEIRRPQPPCGPSAEPGLGHVGLADHGGRPLVRAVCGATPLRFRNSACRRGTFPSRAASGLAPASPSPACWTRSGRVERSRRRTSRLADAIARPGRSTTSQNPLARAVICAKAPIAQLDRATPS